MSDPVLVLDYTMTMNDLRVAISRDDKRRKTDWVRILFALVMLSIAFNCWRDEKYWSSGIILTGAVLMMMPLAILVRSVLLFIYRNQPPATVRIEIDDSGMRMHSAEHKTHNRWWWSRLTGVEETDGSYELMFDGDSHAGMYVPAHAFADDEQRTTFRNLLEQHLPGSTFGNRGASPSDSPAFRFG